MKRTDSWYVYILQCSDGSLYTGIAKDVFRRLTQHNAGKASRYTRSRRPCLLRFMERHATRSSALKREAIIKRLSPKQKLHLIRSCPSF
ncbi:GIY-YIG nuclease family protein [candidate division WOR-3 bacterium]|nr:GIY-YIG nuclease family protein [candidate division WOR-3 bacterium]